jgi:uncharacterized membrane protein
LFLLHPIIVHFTIALLSIAIIADFLHLISKKENFWQISSFLLILGTLSAIGAVITGHQAVDSILVNPQVKELINTHETSGEITMWIFVILTGLRFLLIRFKKFDTRLKWIYYSVGLVALLFLFRTGILGGEMVYIHGVGTAKETDTPASKPSFK